VVVVGSCNVDLVARAERLPRPGETVLARELVVIPGGKGSNQAIAAARAGARSSIIGAVGDDGHAAVIRGALDGAGVDTTELRTVSGPSGIALIVVDDTGGNSIVVVPGANGRLTSLSPTQLEIIGAADVLLLQLEIPVDTVSAAARAARGLRVLNAAPARSLPADLVRVIDLLVANEDEAAIVACGGGDAERDATRLLDLVPRVAITLGADGVLYRDREGARHRVAAPRAQTVDSTAAGDTFAGVLAATLGQGLHILRALQLACAAASLAVESVGASSSIPARASIDARWEAAYGEQRMPLGER
jgi:ribokinase